MLSTTKWVEKIMEVTAMLYLTRDKWLAHGKAVAEPPSLKFSRQDISDFQRGFILWWTSCIISGQMPVNFTSDAEIDRWKTVEWTREQEEDIRDISGFFYGVIDTFDFEDGSFPGGDDTYLEWSYWVTSSVGPLPFLRALSRKDGKKILVDTVSLYRGF
ncbi:hypothetical protein PIIN_10231 [Serendipita indica DSM 11827]|uniref:Uncharacterized protein n=1 Tax=Serendipita indica (strain DSM 11827) TaxID=1109443 RepID=G4TY46_SERID|nr:hypothetical protein PIIN_10231 [Serendipita indica DSM 11827]